MRVLGINETKKAVNRPILIAKNKTANLRLRLPLLAIPFTIAKLPILILAITNENCSYL